MGEPKLGDRPEAVQFTILYSDGSREVVDKGLLARLMPNNGVEVLAMKVHPPEFLTVLAALEGAAERIVSEAQ